MIFFFFQLLRYNKQHIYVLILVQWKSTGYWFSESESVNQIGHLFPLK